MHCFRCQTGCMPNSAADPTMKSRALGWRASTSGGGNREPARAPERDAGAARAAGGRGGDLRGGRGLLGFCRQLPRISEGSESVPPQAHSLLYCAGFTCTSATSEKERTLTAGRIGWFVHAAPRLAGLPPPIHHAAGRKQPDSSARQAFAGWDSPAFRQMDESLLC